MSRNGGGFWRFTQKMRAGFHHFMMGRYGSDKLNMTILWVGVGACVLSMLLPFPLLKLLLCFGSYGLMFWAIFRALSRNTYRRYQENRRYLRFLERIRDREHKHFDCPRCKQPVRVPRGKGKIAITCPKCREKFIKKT